MDKRLLWVGGAVALWLLLRPKSSAAAPAAATTSAGSSPTGFANLTPIGLASVYFDPGQDVEINANVNSPSFGNTIN